MPAFFTPRRALTLLETVIALLLIIVLLAVLLPALSTARMTSHREACASNLRKVGGAWESYLAENKRQFPHIPVQPGWHYGGMRFSGTDGSAFPDPDRPLTTYLPLHRTANFDEVCVCCPADRGIGDPAMGLGTGARTAFRSFGNSYRMNAALVNLPVDAGIGESRGEFRTRALHRSEITTPPSRLLLAGDPVWYEVAEETNLAADWHGVAASGNILFLDGHVRFMTIRPKREVGPVLFDPFIPATIVGLDE